MTQLPSRSVAGVEARQGAGQQRLLGNVAQEAPRPTHTHNAPGSCVSACMSSSTWLLALWRVSPGGRASRNVLQAFLIPRYAAKHQLQRPCRCHETQRAWKVLSWTENQSSCNCVLAKATCQGSCGSTYPSSIPVPQVPQPRHILIQGRHVTTSGRGQGVGPRCESTTSQCLLQQHELRHAPVLLAPQL
jgi:hypothetical protein